LGASWPLWLRLRKHTRIPLSKSNLGGSGSSQQSSELGDAVCSTGFSQF
jgi:hypothetical protein